LESITQNTDVTPEVQPPRSFKDSGHDPHFERLAKNPENLADFMTEKEIRHRLDLTLAKGLQAALPQLAGFMDDSRDVLKN